MLRLRVHSAKTKRDLAYYSVSHPAVYLSRYLLHQRLFATMSCINLQLTLTLTMLRHVPSSITPALSFAVLLHRLRNRYIDFFASCWTSQTLKSYNRPPTTLPPLQLPKLPAVHLENGWHKPQPADQHSCNKCTHRLRRQGAVLIVVSWLSWSRDGE